MSSEPEEAAYSPALDRQQVGELLGASANDDSRDVYIDAPAELAKTADNRAKVRQKLQENFSLRLTDAVERVWQLPTVVVHRSDAEYISLLDEARELFKMGYFYSCVAMCGIVGEKLIKDLLRTSIQVSRDGVPTIPSPKAFEELAKLNASSLVNFATETELISADTRKAALRLGELRNEYAHARGRNPQRDALEAIEKLHLVIDGTVSLLNFEITIDAAASANSPLVEEE
jgi:hypothetical protein